MTEYPEDEWLDLSGINHYSYCPRRWALVNIEQIWQDNIFTTMGSMEHQRAHDYAASETRGDVLILRDLKVHSRRLGISGACDVVEFHANDNGVTLCGRTGKWMPYPIEYKHGASKRTEGYKLQLCLEAICLEEMLACEISEGALYYRKTRRREKVDLNNELREKVENSTKRMHELYREGYTPRVRRNKQLCESCSLREACMPELGDVMDAAAYMKKMTESSEEEVSE
ncbi:CRISPR-associated protein Cas4 [Bifidobacterium callitrichos]|nr:CRISPR-associated protein Cas4 [Bifidobacterium callitrichos]